MFADLLAQPGVVEQVELRSTLGVMAFHGGNLERGTDDIAREAAARAGASFYAVVQPPDLRWHIPSDRFDPAHSAALAAFVEHVEVTVAIHGYGREGLFTTVLLGGRNRLLAAHIGGALRAALVGYEVIDDLDAIPAELRGQHPRNPVNRVRGGGVQVELPPRVRGLGPYWDERGHERDEHGRAPHTRALIDGLVLALASWPRDA